MRPDLFILAAEPSADLHGSNLIKALLSKKPDLKISAVAGPLMRTLPIEAPFSMENLQVMGFLDVIAALPSIAKQFFSIRNHILSVEPKAVVSIDYPGFNLRLAASLKKNKFKGKLIHYICPSVWAWGKKRIPKMAETLDLLLTLFPFEKDCFASTGLAVEHVGHPLTSQIPAQSQACDLKPPILALFPGSRATEIKRNYPLQIATAKRLAARFPGLRIATSIAQPSFEAFIKHESKGTAVDFYPADQKMDLMNQAQLAIATSGTITLELALASVPTVVNFAIRDLDVWIAQKIFRINLPFYCIVNIMLSKQIFPELFGPHLTSDSLYHWAEKLWRDQGKREEIQRGCLDVRKALGEGDGSSTAAHSIISLVYNHLL